MCLIIEFADINFDYFTIHDLHSNKDIINCLDVLLRDVCDPSSMFDSFYNKISEVIDTHKLPIKQLSRQELKMSLKM